MQISPNRSALQNIAALVLAANPDFASALTAANIFFDSSVDASAVTPLTDDPTGHNAQVTLTAKTDSSLTGSTTIKYTRLSATDAASQKTPAMNPEILNTKFMQIGKTTSGLPTNKSSNASIGLQFDGTVTTIGYASNGYTLAPIYTAKKAK